MASEERAMLTPTPGNKLFYTVQDKLVVVRLNLTFNNNDYGKGTYRK